MVALTVVFLLIYLKFVLTKTILTRKKKKTRKSILSYSIYVSNGIICCVNCFSNNHSDRVFAGILNTLPLKVRRLFKE